MANFIPFKIYILSLLDELISKHNISDPFLDIGCGKGEVALHLAQKGWYGDAIDISLKSVEVTKEALIDYPKISVYQASISEVLRNNFNLILLLDVLEHIPDDGSFLRIIAKKGKPGAYLFITVPSNPEQEWRWDDEVYGHLRRYRPGDIQQLLGNAGFYIVEMLEISTPIFWILRRAYTAMKYKPSIVGSQLQRTLQSPFSNAWDLGWISKLLSNPKIWKPAFGFQKKFRNRLDRGHEMAILAQRI